MSTTTARPAVWRRDDGHWSGEVRVVDENGRTRRLTTTADSRAEALRRLAARRQRVEAGQTDRDSRLTVGAVAQRWVDVTLPASRRAETTRELYAGDVARYLLDPVSPNDEEPNAYSVAARRRHRRGDLTARLGRIPLADLTASDVEAALLEMERAGYGISVRRRFLTILRAILDTGARDGLVARDVARLVDRPTEPAREARAFTGAQVAQLLESVREDRLAPLVVVLALTGLRSGELRALRWTGIDLDAATLRSNGTLVRVRGRGLVVSDGKGRSRRSVPLLPAAVDALRAWRRTQTLERLALGPAWVDTGYVFTTPIGTPLDAANLGRWFAGLARAADLDGTPHTLRHAFASALLADGESVRTVAELLGHSKTSTTWDTYGHVAPELKAAAVDRLVALYVTTPPTAVTSQITSQTESRPTPAAEKR